MLLNQLRYTRVAVFVASRSGGCKLTSVLVVNYNRVCHYMTKQNTFSTSRHISHGLFSRCAQKPVSVMFLQCFSRQQKRLNHPLSMSLLLTNQMVSISYAHISLNSSDVFVHQLPHVTQLYLI